MAEVQIDDTTNCQVCFEEFSESGDYVPRIFPCSHTVCEKCVKGMVKRKKLECPECRTEHDAENGHLSFPQNKYVICNGWNLKQKLKCQLHKKGIVVYCNEEECKKAICITCMLNEHKNHDMQEFEHTHSEKRESLLASLSTLNKDLETKQRDLLEKKEFLSKQSKTCVEKMKQKKIEVMKAFDDMIEEAEKNTETMKKEIDDAVETLREKQKSVKQMETLVPAGKFDKLTEVTEKVTQIRGTVTKDTLKYKFLDFVPAKPDVKNSCGIYSCLELTAAYVMSRAYPSRAEATFEYTVKNVSTLKRQYSPEFMVQNLPWDIRAIRITKEGATPSDNLAFYLVCKGPSKSTSWSCKVNKKLSLLNHNPNKTPLSKGGEEDDIYRAGDASWGYRNFISWKDLMDTDKGYYNVKDDSVTLQVHLVAEKPTLRK